MISEMIGLT